MYLYTRAIQTYERSFQEPCDNRHILLHRARQHNAAVYSLFFKLAHLPRLLCFILYALPVHYVITQLGSFVACLIPPYSRARPTLIKGYLTAQNKRTQIKLRCTTSNQASLFTTQQRALIGRLFPLYCNSLYFAHLIWTYADNQYCLLSAAFFAFFRSKSRLRIKLHGMLFVFDDFCCHFRNKIQHFQVFLSLQTIQMATPFWSREVSDLIESCT